MRLLLGRDLPMLGGGRMIDDITVCKQANEYLRDETAWGERVAGGRRSFCGLCDFCAHLEVDA